jgi:hypothetical protein
LAPTPTARSASRWNGTIERDGATLAGVTALIFLLVAIAMLAALGRRRGVAGGLFGLGFVLSVVWLVHHMTAPLALSF